MGRGGAGHERSGKSVLGGFRDCAVRVVGRVAAGCEKKGGGTGVTGAANGLAGGSDGGGGKVGGSGSCGRTGHGAWGP